MSGVDVATLREPNAIRADLADIVPQDGMPRRRIALLECDLPAALTEIEALRARLARQDADEAELRIEVEMLRAELATEQEHCRVLNAAVLARDARLARQDAALRETWATIPAVFDGSHLADCPYVDVAANMIAVKKKHRAALDVLDAAVRLFPWEEQKAEHDAISKQVDEWYAATLAWQRADLAALVDEIEALRRKEAQADVAIRAGNDLMDANLRLSVELEEARARLAMYADTSESSERVKDALAEQIVALRARLARQDQRGRVVSKVVSTPTIRRRGAVARRFMFFGFGGCICGWLLLLFFWSLPLPKGHSWGLGLVPLIVYASLCSIAVLSGATYLVTRR